MGTPAGAFSKASTGRFAEGKAHGDFHDHCDPGGVVAHLVRLIASAVLVLMALCALPAYATISPLYLWHGSQYCPDDTDKALVAMQSFKRTYLASCTAADPQSLSCTITTNTSTNYDISCTYVANGGYSYSGTGAAVRASTASVCPANSTLSGGTCVCNSGYGENAGQCIVAGSAKWAQWCSAATGLAVGTQGVLGKNVTTGCLGDISIAGSPVPTPGYQAGDLPDGAGCTVSLGGDRVSYQDASGQWITGGKATIAGGTCMEGATQTPGTVPSSAPPGTTGQPQTAPSPCPSGQAPGTVNGTAVCAPMGSETPTAAPSPQSGGETTTNPDGTSTTRSTTGTTECSKGTCTTTNTTTTTTRDAAGNVTGASTAGSSSQMSLSAFCQANAKSAQCAGEGDGKGGSFSGDCVAGFKADGDDPVLNAMALEQYKRNCQLLRTDSPESQAYDAAKDVAGTTKAANPNDSTVSIGAGNFDTSDALGGGGCNLNKTVVVRGYSATLPFNVLCDPLAVLGQLLVAVSLLLAARIVTRG